MSPEQARGHELDNRVDIWAFGVVLYEMVTGERMFQADSAGDVIAAVLTCEPNLDRAPVQVRRLLASCLEKDPRRRLRHIGDAMRLAEPVSDRQQAAVLPPSPPGRTPLDKTWIGLASVLGLVAAVALAGWWHATRPVDRPLTRFALDLGPNAIGGADAGIAISPDGRRIVFPMRGPDGQAQLATRLLDQSQPSLLPGTSDGHLPFFSPDGQWIGYFAHSTLSKISVLGGAPVTLATIGDIHTGGGWDGQGNVLAAFTHSASLSLIPSAGGSPRLFTKLEQGEQTHRWPQPLPGGGVLFTDHTIVMGMETAKIAVADAKTGAHRIVLSGGFGARYVPGGYLLYVHQGVLSAVRFDLSQWKVEGSPVPLVEDLDANSLTGDGHYQFSGAPDGAGTLVYLQGKAMPQQWNVILLDSSGKRRPLIPPGAYYNPAFSPDGQKLALSAGPQGVDIVVHDLAHGTNTRLTSDGTSDRPVWAPDGKGIFYGSKKSPPGIWWVRADAGAESELLLASSHPVVPWSLSPDGKRLAYFEVDPQTGYDMWVLPLDLSDRAHPKAGRPVPFLRSQFNEGSPAFSPDGRWIAYHSNESGLDESYVRPAAGEPGKWQISNGGGMFPAWSPNGREIYYESPGNYIQAVEYAVKGDALELGKRRQWSDLKLQFVAKGNYAVAPDGKHIPIFEAVYGGAGPPRVGVLLNFLEELKRKLP